MRLSSTTITVNGKTGMRNITITKSYPRLKDWLSIHPLAADPNAYLYCRQIERTAVEE